MLSKALFFFSLFSVAFATVYITTPVSTTVYSGGQKDATVVWQDDNAAPSLKQFGNASVSIYVGNLKQQTLLQTLVASVDVSTTSTITFTPDPTIGPDDNQYFIRIQSLAFKDASGFPGQAFSAKFTLNQMTGTFNASVLSQIAGQSTAPLAQTTSGSTSSTGSASLTSATSSKSPSSTSSTSSTAKATSGAMGLETGWAGIVFGAVAGVMMF